MSTKPYTTKLEVENYLLTTVDPSFDTQIATWISAMSRYIDNYCNRIIYDDTPSTMLYDGDNTDIILIKDCVDITEVKLDGVVVDTYFKYPQGKTYTSRIKLQDQYFSNGLQNVSVTGIHAMDKVLRDDIKFACTVLVAGIVNASMLGNKRGTTEKIGGYAITYKDNVQEADYSTAKKILSSYKRIAL